MNKLEQAARQALEALERWKEWDERTQQEMHDDIDDAAITALREALAEQAEQEPVAWMDLHKELGQLRWAGKDIGWDLAIDAVRNRLEELYATPVRTKDLTDYELQPFLDEWWNLPCDTAHDVKKIFRAVIAADRRKNK